MMIIIVFPISHNLFEWCNKSEPPKVVHFNHLEGRSIDRRSGLNKAERRRLISSEIYEIDRSKRSKCTYMILTSLLMTQ